MTQPRHEGHEDRIFTEGNEGNEGGGITGSDELLLIRVFGIQTNPDEQEIIPTGPQSWSQLRRSGIFIETPSKSRPAP